MSCNCYRHYCALDTEKVTYYYLDLMPGFYILLTMTHFIQFHLIVALRDLCLFLSFQSSVWLNHCILLHFFENIQTKNTYF